MPKQIKVSPLTDAQRKDLAKGAAEVVAFIERTMQSEKGRAKMNAARKLLSEQVKEAHPKLCVCPPEMVAFLNNTAELAIESALAGIKLCLLLAAAE